MSLFKRLRVLWAALTQEWSEESCAACGASWMQQGVKVSDLCLVCDAKETNRWLDELEQRFGREKGAA